MPPGGGDCWGGRWSWKLGEDLASVPCFGGWGPLNPCVLLFSFSVSPAVCPGESHLSLKHGSCDTGTIIPAPWDSGEDGVMTAGQVLSKHCCLVPPGLGRHNLTEDGVLLTGSVHRRHGLLSMPCSFNFISFALIYYNFRLNC